MSDPTTVLLIEDNPGDARLIQELLTEAAGISFELEWQNRLSAGLERLAQGGIGVILLDLGLPDSQGLGTLAQVQARSAEAPVVVLTGLDDKTLGIEAVHQGAQDYLVKGQGDGDVLVRAMRYAIERKRAKETLARRAREMAALYQTSLEINHLPDVSTLLRSIVQRAVELVGARMGGLYLMQPDSETLELVVNYNLPGDYLGAALRQGEDLSGRVAQTGEPMIVEDYLQWQGRAAVYADAPFRRAVGVPLKMRDNVIGVINVIDDQKAGSFDEDQVRLVSLFADQAAIAVANARLVEALRGQTVELQARNEELDAFAHTVAHDLKSLAAHMVGFAEELEETGAVMPDEELRGHLRTISRNGRKMSSVIDELLLLASVRKAQAKIEPLDMPGIVGEVRQRLAPLIEEYQAEIILPNAWPAALGYGPWVEEVWVNYISNAIKYGGWPPRVELGADPLSDPVGAPRARDGMGGGMVRLWVRDNGPGISAEQQARLFAPFVRIDPAGAKGHGVGLSIVKRIVEKLGGQVSVESEGVPGRGSVFAFTLPRVCS
jgi:signal transduction histidine kinase/DNA-binding NarL/FixJ family response regulator